MSVALNIHKSYVDELVASLVELKIVHIDANQRVRWRSAATNPGLVAMQAPLLQLADGIDTADGQGPGNSLSVASSATVTLTAAAAAVAAEAFVGSSSRVRSTKQQQIRRQRLLVDFVCEHGAVAVDADLRIEFRKLEVFPL
jgi:hypothetical protein